MTNMKIKLKQIRPNPFRDFSLYPIDEEQVQRLYQSIDELGFFTGVTARRADGGFELAAGHHRLKAAADYGLDEIEAVVEAYTDLQMVEIMAAENLLQRGHNAASTLDSVAAFAKIITKEVLLGEGNASKILEASGPRHLASAQATIAQHGPGMPLIYRAMNRFNKAERKANKQAEKITSTDIDQALTTLKTGGIMGRIVSDAYAEVEAIRAERAEEERVKREKEDRAAAAAEEKRRKQEARQEAELKKKQEAEAAAEKKRQEAAEKSAAAKAAAAAEAEKRKREREEAEAELAAQREADKAERAAEKKAKAERDAADKAERERQAKEKAAIKAQKALEAIYDPACSHIFRLTSHEKAFRDVVLSDNGRRFIPKDQQLPLAKQIRGEIDEIEAKRGHDLGSVTIASMLDAHMARLLGIQRDIDKQEKDRLLRENAQKRVEELWSTLRRGVQQADSALEKLVNEQTNWAYDVALFPMHLDDIDRVIEIGRRMGEMKKAIGY